MRPVRDRLAGWRDAFAQFRDSCYASADFQRWAARFWLTRPLAQRRARALFDLCAGFVYSQVLLACVQLRLLDRVRDRPETAEVLSQATAVPLDALLRLLEAAAALGLLEERGRGRYGLGPHGAALLGNPGVVAMIEHHALLYADLADPVAMLRAPRGAGRLARYWAYAGADAPSQLGGEAVAAYTQLMSRSQTLVVHDILAAFPFDRHRRLLDVGGGDGTFLAAVAARHPALECVLFDLPAVAERARRRFAELGLPVRACGGDFSRDPLPDGVDLLSFVRVLHDHDDEVVLALLAAAWRALVPGGSLLIAEPLAGTRGAEPMGAAYFGIYLYAMGRGRPRTFDEYRAMLQRSGFESVKDVPTPQPLQTRLLVARKSKNVMRD